MAIQASELKWYQSSVVNDTSGNGGTMSANEIADGVKNNVWPDVPQAERLSGSVKYRKTFIKVANEDNLTLITPKIFIETHTPGDDSVVLMVGTQTDTQSEAVGYTPFFGSGDLDLDVSAGDATLIVNVEDGNGQAEHEIFQDGGLVRISDQANVDDVTGNSEFVRLAASNAVAWNGNQATLTLETGVSLTHAYLAADTKVASAIESNDIAASMSGWSESSVAGTYDVVISPPILDNIGTIEQTWTLTWTDATHYSCIGDTVGLVGNGTIDGSDFAPNNPDFNRPYFTLLNSSPPWGGTWEAADTITFQTHPAAIAIWEKRTVPAGADSFSGNKVVVAITGESA